MAPLRGRAGGGPDPVALPVDALRARHGEIYLIVAPPRTASTALARLLWQDPGVGFYCHEPYDAVFHRGAGEESAARALRSAVEVKRLAGDEASRGDALVVKEMTFQVGDHFAALAALATRPVVFLVRDPRLTIASRMRQREKGGQAPVFPTRESGWQDLSAQLALCRERGIPFSVLDATDLRNRPQEVLPPLCRRLGIAYSRELLRWRPADSLGLGSLGGEQAHWYRRVLASRGLEPETRTPPPLDAFPAAGGFRDHVRECLAIYLELTAPA